jgi:hypothetical protein
VLWPAAPPRGVEEGGTLKLLSFNRQTDTPLILRKRGGLITDNDVLKESPLYTTHYFLNFKRL